MVDGSWHQERRAQRSRRRTSNTYGGCNLAHKRLTQCLRAGLFKCRPPCRLDPATQTRCVRYRVPWMKAACKNLPCPKAHWVACVRCESRMRTFLLTGTTFASNMASYDMSLDAIWNRFL